MANAQLIPAWLSGNAQFVHAWADVFVDGTLVATEVGQDTAAAFGKITVKGAFSVTESGVDTFSATVGSTSTGNLVGVETGADTATVAGKVLVKGTIAVSESNDSVLASGSVSIAGQMTLTEIGDDSFSALSLPPITIGVFVVAVVKLATIAKKHARKKTTLTSKVTL